MQPLPAVSVGSLPLKLAFSAAAFDTGMPVLAGDPIDRFFADAIPVAKNGALSLFRSPDWLVGTVSLSPSAGLEATTVEIYREIFNACRGLHLARVWHFVPAINATDANGLENYRSFCRGRSLAFERHHGAGFAQVVPAASAVGTAGPNLLVVFAASEKASRHIENPLQVPAYEYPPEYGPRAPSFARATIVPRDHGLTVFISGTAAIRGHATVAPHCTADQLACTLENLNLISVAAGIGPMRGAAAGALRHFKVYLRHAEDQPLVARILDEQLLRAGDRVVYLRADICREPLTVEIEASIRISRPSGP
jgi:chorismate lyase / 3-hydroxybenzoate synthase